MKFPPLPLLAVARLRAAFAERDGRRRHADELPDHLRRDIGLAPQDPMARVVDRARFGLPL